MTCRKIMGYGLVAGLQLRDMYDMAPGLILDLYIYRRNYDDMEHGLKRMEEQIYD